MHLGKYPRFPKSNPQFLFLFFFRNNGLITTKKKESSDTGKKKSNANQTTSQSIRAVTQGPSALRSCRQTTEN